MDCFLLATAGIVEIETDFINQAPLRTCVPIKTCRIQLSQEKT